MDKRVVGDRIMERKRLFQMRPGRRKPAGEHQVSTGGAVTQNEAGGIVALTAQMQQILGQTLRQVEFAAEQMIAGLPIGNLKELRGGTQLLPQLPCAGIGMTRFRRREAFDGLQGRTQGSAKFELLSLSFGGIWQ